MLATCAVPACRAGKRDANVHAGANKEVPFDEQNRTLFAFAAYNAGPGKIRTLRREAEA